MKKSLFKYVVASSDQGLCLLDYIKRFYPLLSKKRLKQLIEEKNFFVNGSPEIFAQHKLKKGDEVVFSEEYFTREKKLCVLYEDEALTIYNKPPYVACSHPMHVHRLDKETSGIYLVARTIAAKEQLEKQFKERKVHKQYIAIALYSDELLKGVRKTKLRYKMDHNNQKIGMEASDGLTAITHFSVIERKGKLALLQCIPITGRTHQIRIHLSAMGAPILGDEKYGGKKVFPFYVTRHMLHAQSIQFHHPITNEEIRILADCPDDFKKAMSHAHFNH